MILALRKLSSALEMPSQFPGFSSGSRNHLCGGRSKRVIAQPRWAEEAQGPGITMSQRLLLQLMELSPRLQERLRNVLNVAYMLIFTSTSTILTIMAILPVLDPLLLWNPLRVQLEVLLLVRSVHCTLGVILLGITLPIEHPTSLVLLHVLAQAQRWISHSPRRFA